MVYRSDMSKAQSHHILSVVLAVHNEAAHLQKCLAAIQSLADEIIVVDGESTDETISIAKSYQAQIISTTNKLNFHINKKMGLEAATGILVLQLDADEVVDSELLTFLHQIKNKFAALSHDEIEQFQPKGWYLRRRNWFLGRFLTKGGQYPDPVIRVYVRGFATLPAQDVHEQISVNGEVGWADGHLLHYSNPEFGDYLRKFNHYTSLKAVQLRDAGVKVTLGGTVAHFFWLPLRTFFSLYIRHRGLVDGVPGFVFALMSGLHHVFAYLKLWEMYEKDHLSIKSDSSKSATSL